MTDKAPSPSRAKISDDLAPPGGLVLAGQEKGDVLGCACCLVTSLRSPLNTR